MGRIDNFSVTANEQGLVITATPYCVAWTSRCDAWVRYPGQARQIINPRNGWSTPWPSGWSPGSNGTVEIGFYLVDVFGFQAYGEPPLTKSVKRPEVFVGLTASVDSVNQSGKSATISGSATKGAEIRRNGSRVSDSDGRWNATVSGLQVGSNALKFDQYVNGEYRDTRSVSVTIDPPAPTLTATGLFPADHTQLARISGVAAKGATVIIRSGATIVADVPANGTDGSYVWDVPAPNAGGAKQYTVSQRVSGVESGNVPVSLNYGTAVSITSLEDGGEAEPGPQPISGVGEDGASVTVSVNGNVLPVTAVEGGTWRVDGDLRRGENTVMVTQQSKGANTTTSTVVVNPGESSEMTPVTVDGPATVIAGRNNTFDGEGEPGATLEIVNKWGTNLLPAGATVPVAADGTWEFDRVVSASAKNFEFYAVQTSGGMTKKYGPFTIQAEDPNASLREATVTGPASVNLGANNTFRGTATPDADIRIVNASNTDLVAPIRADAQGSWTFDRVVSWNAKNFTFFIEQSKGAATKKSGPFVIPPMAFEAPTVATQSVTPGVNNTFTGTATPGVTLRIENASGTDLIAGERPKVGDDGRWTFDRVIDYRATNFKFHVVQIRSNGDEDKSELFTIFADRLIG